MRNMLNTLLDFFCLDNGKEQPGLSPCRISIITHTLETEFMPIAMNKGLSLTMKNRNDAVVLTDKERTIQIVNNQLSNAIKFTEKGGVSLTTNYIDEVLTITVEDTGTGMTEDEQQRVSNAFERLSNAAAKDSFGLGLAIVHNIVTMLHGKIKLNSENLNVIAIYNDKALLLVLKEMYAQEGIHCDTRTDTEELLEHGFAGYLFKSFSISELMEVSDRCAIKTTQDGKPDFSTLLSYGNEAVI